MVAHLNRGGRRRNPGRNLGAVRFDTSVSGEDATVLTADRDVYFSSNVRQRREELLNVSHKKQCMEPSELDDGLAQWIPVPDEDMEDLMNDVLARRHRRSWFGLRALSL
ncbi:hypothetical protein DFH07DRAFT_974843 [Mycena maculata]|uniref:Uncharacterized protein n=1 Tax=Mycena maculata TaxID=230809 RepID=A0AAD7H668_9AGAR|nr:hypothetical protein DFH07DRAFT_974843 [Mycena maculata]